MACRRGATVSPCDCLRCASTRFLTHPPSAVPLRSPCPTSCCEEAQCLVQHCGLDEAHGLRLWRSGLSARYRQSIRRPRDWHWHVSLVMMALALLAVIRHPANALPPKAGPEHSGAAPDPLILPGNPPPRRAAGAAVHPSWRRRWLRERRPVA